MLEPSRATGSGVERVKGWTVASFRNTCSGPLREDFCSQEVAGRRRERGTGRSFWETATTRTSGDTAITNDEGVEARTRSGPISVALKRSSAGKILEKLRIEPASLVTPKNSEQTEQNSSRVLG